MPEYEMVDEESRNVEDADSELSLATYVAPNYKTLFFFERVNHTHGYMLEPIPLSAIRTMVSSHTLRCETGRWGISDKIDRLCIFFLEQVRESEYHTLLQCSAFDHI